MGKCVTAQYRMLEEYKADIQNIVHNVVIYHGAHSNMADQARQMFRDCVYDITELTTCRDCYRCHSSQINKCKYGRYFKIRCLVLILYPKEIEESSCSGFQK